MTAELGPILLVGGGGLVGRHVRASAEADGLHVVAAKVPWEDPEASVSALHRTIEDFISIAAERWTLVWAAGAGVVATPEEALATEVAVFGEAMVRLSAVGRSRGAVVLVSSAGGIHAGSANPPFTEATAAAPRVAYGHAKLAMESIATEHCAGAGLRLLLLRPANVYGPGQRLDKPQGLVSQIALAHTTGDPLPLLVAQDTLRDYVYAPDLGALVVAALSRLQDQAPGSVTTKIVASGVPTSVAHLVGQARRVLRRPLRTTLVSGRATGQVQDLRFRSTVWTDLDAHLRTPLPVGMAQTARDVQERVARWGRHGPLDAGLSPTGGHRR